MVVSRCRVLTCYRDTKERYQLLYCTTLYCTVLHCTVLYCTVLYCRYQAELEAWAGEAGWHSRDRGHSLVLAASCLSFRSKRSVSAAADCRAAAK